MSWKFSVNYWGKEIDEKSILQRANTLNRNYTNSHSFSFKDDAYYASICFKAHNIRNVFLTADCFIYLTSNAAERLTWCAYYDGKPWIYPINAKYDGVLIEQLTIFEKNNNIKTTVIEDLPWKRCQREVEIGNIDMVLGAYKTKEREKIIFLF